MSYNNRILKFQSGGKYFAKDLKKAGNRAFGQPLYYDKRTGDLIQISSEDALTRDGWSKGEVVRTGNQMKNQPYSVFNIFGWEVIDPYKGISQVRQKQSNEIEVNRKKYASASDWRKEQAARQQPVATGSVTTNANRTGKVNNRINRNINRPNYAKNFTNFQFSPEEIAYMKSLNYDPTDARSVQEFILSETPDANLGVRKGVGKTDGLWGQQSIAAFQALRDKGIFKPKAIPIVEQPVLDAADPFGYSTTNHYDDGMALKELGFNNYSGLKNYVIANQNNQFAKDLKQRFGNDVNAWNQTDVENALGVSGTYRGGYTGDFGDMARSMARWAGETNAAYDTKKEASVAKPTFNTQEMLNNVKSLKFTAPEWKFSLNQGNIGASTLGNLPSTKPQSINLSQESNKQENLGNLDQVPYAQQKGYIK